MLCNAGGQVINECSGRRRLQLVDNNAVTFEVTVPVALGGQATAEEMAAAVVEQASASLDLVTSDDCGDK